MTLFSKYCQLYFTWCQFCTQPARVVWPQLHIVHHRHALSLPPMAPQILGCQGWPQKQSCRPGISGVPTHDSGASSFEISPPLSTPPKLRSTELMLLTALSSRMCSGWLLKSDMQKSKVIKTNCTFKLLSTPLKKEIIVLAEDIN